MQDLRLYEARLPLVGRRVNDALAVMEARWRGPRFGCREGWRVLVPVILASLVGVVVAKKPAGENVHRPDADCMGCHTADQTTLGRDRAAARALLAADLEERCVLCHNDEGPSHHTGIRPRKAVPDSLPLSAEGLITCATCHFVHGEPNAADDFLRIDNSRGGLCLTCHELSELQ
jgi:hypothetical protein